MIQFKRGSTKNWLKLKKPLEAGQPGYDKDKNKIKIGDGESLWDSLPYASGLSAEDVINSEELAKTRHDLDPEDGAVITYGTDSPDKNTVGQVYLQYYDSEPEVDYVVEIGKQEMWNYRKWKSGRAECWGTLLLSTSIQTTIEDTAFFSDNNAMKAVNYPFIFKEIPCETASLQSPGGLVWLASRKANTESHSALYNIIGLKKLASLSKYRITLRADGYWK